MSHPRALLIILKRMDDFREAISEYIERYSDDESFICKCNEENWCKIHGFQANIVALMEHVDVVREFAEDNGLG
jgi:hypothetical protein